MTQNEKYMHRCLELAALGQGTVAPNPMVGSVIVHNGIIIGEGYHQQYGQAHAEVNAVNAVVDKELLSQCTLYVNLEPCSHFGKTPPCSDLIIEHHIPRVVIGTVDYNSMVNGIGIEKLRNAGVEVTVGVLENECRKLNKRFFTFHQKKRPYIILKWAQTTDGFIDAKRPVNSVESPVKISNEESHQLSHLWRSHEQAIMVGTNTVLMDNPKLTTRLVKGANPIRVCIDKKLRIPSKYHLMDGSVPTIIFTEVVKLPHTNLEFFPIDFSQNILPQIMNVLFEKNIQSLIVEGGQMLLTSFINANLWDEARVFIAPMTLGDGCKAPAIEGETVSKTVMNGDELLFYKNN